MNESINEFYQFLVNVFPEFYISYIIHTAKIGRMLYLSVVRSVLGYACKSSMVSPDYRLDKTNRACPKESVKIHVESSLLVRRFLSRQINSFGTDTPIILARVYGSSVLLQSHKWSG